MIGRKPDRLMTLEHRTAAMQRDLDTFQSRTVASPGLKYHHRLVRIETPVAAGYNTFNVTFLDGDFVEAEGQQTPSYDDRQSTTAVAHHIAIPPPELEIGDIVLAHRWSDRWWLVCGSPGTGPPTPVKLLVNWRDWNRDETNLTWVEAYAASRGVLGRFDAEPLPPADPNWPGDVFMRRNAAGSVDLSSLGLSSGTPIASAIITLTVSGIAASTVNYVGDADIQDEDNPPLATTYTSEQIDLWAAAAGGPIAYTLTPGLGDQVEIDVTTLVQNVINRPGFAGQNMNLRITTNVTQPINGPSSGSFGAGIANITQVVEDSFISIAVST